MDIAINTLESEKIKAKTQEEREKLQALIDTTKEMQSSYNNYAAGIAPRGKEHPVLTPAAAAVALYFSSSGYLLSFELLVHAQDNNKLNSSYSPHYGNRISSSPIVARIKQSKEDVTGSAAFENSGTKVQKDLYYAIHAFDYTFTRSTLSAFSCSLSWENTISGIL